ncbi:MAG: hypothetical protein JRJ31_20380 [Deltaproteobacteria bacterium]|nr:hypothetical protein [Deltaproteobacteria bacterium]
MIIPFILEKALSLYAEKEAVVCHEHRNTYQQFAHRTYRLANLLHTMRVKKVTVSQSSTRTVTNFWKLILQQRI